MSEKKWRRIMGLEDRQPCWYIELLKNEKKEKSKIKIGVVSGDDKDEIILKISNITDEIDKNWDHITSLSFLISMLAAYKAGGKKEIDRWAENAV